jgi:hypothetical protein
MLTPGQIVWAAVLVVVCVALIIYALWCPACAH